MGTSTSGGTSGAGSTGPGVGSTASTGSSTGSSAGRSTGGGFSSWGLWMVAAGAAVWGLDALFRVDLVRALSSLQIVWLEHVLLSLAVLPLLVRSRGLKHLNGREWLLLLSISWGSSALATWLFTEAFRYGDLNAVILLQKLQPLFALLAARWLLAERLPRSYFTLLAVALAGGYLVSFGWGVPFGQIPREAWIGSLLALASAGFWGAGTAFGRRLLGKLTFSELTAARFVFALPMLSVLMAFNGGYSTQLTTLSASLWVDIALLSLFPGFIGIMLYYYGLRGTKASYATVAELMFPATALLVNWLAFDRPVTPLQLVGVVLIWLAVYLLQQDGHKRGLALRRSQTRPA